jgi:hypothetical protein
MTSRATISRLQNVGNYTSVDTYQVDDGYMGGGVVFSAFVKSYYNEG